MFTLSWSNVKSAIVYGLLTLVAVFLFSVAQSVLDVGSIFGLDWKHIVDTAVIATIPSVVTVLSLLKNFLTTNKGKFLGVATVIPDKEK